MRAKMSILHPNRTTPTISTLFYISILCHVSILSGILSRGVGFDVSICYIAFWRVHLMGAFFLLIGLNGVRFAYAPSAL